MEASQAFEQGASSAAIAAALGNEDQHRFKFYAPTVLGPKQRMTPEGFLVCEDVQIARIGELIYVEGEIGHKRWRAITARPGRFDQGQPGRG